jgi:hypothetical protein
MDFLMDALDGLAAGNGHNEHHYCPVKLKGKSL